MVAPGAGMQRGPCHAEIWYDFAASGITNVVAAGAAAAVALRTAETGPAATAAAGDKPVTPSAIAAATASA